MNTVDFLKESVTADLVRYLMQDEHLSVQQALEDLCSTDTFLKLFDTETGLYRESSAYVYEFLKEERQNDRIF